MSNIVPINGNLDIVAALHELADHIDAMPEDARPVSVTVVAGRSVYCFGPISKDRCAEAAAYDLLLGQQLLVAPSVRIAMRELGL